MWCNLAPQSIFVYPQGDAYHNNTLRPKVRHDIPVMRPFIHQASYFNKHMDLWA